MNAINNHHSLWNDDQADAYVSFAKADFFEEFDAIRKELFSMGMLSVQNFIGEFKLFYPDADTLIMEATGLAYVGI